MLTDLYRREASLSSRSFAAQRDAILADACAAAEDWGPALAPLGYDTEVVFSNAEASQRAWASENGFTGGAAGVPWEEAACEILLAQIRLAKPDVLWFDGHDPRHLTAIREKAPKIRLVLGWVGSALPVRPVWKDVDVMLSCAPESVTRLRSEGFRAEHLDHSFDPRVQARLSQNRPRHPFVFVGQIIRTADFHKTREPFLEALVDGLPLEIFSPTPVGFLEDVAKFSARSVVFTAAQALRSVGVKDSMISRLPLIRKALEWRGAPALSVSHKLRPRVKPGVFGIHMIQLLKDTDVTLNIHADSSPTHASNMRLFEATGAGSCLLTDWRDNLADLFEPEKEVVTYRSIAECIEKATWLLKNPESRQAIAKAGHARVLKDHTILQRAKRLDQLIRKELA